MIAQIATNTATISENKIQYHLLPSFTILNKINNPRSIGAHMPIKMPCNSSPERNRYSATIIIMAHSTSIIVFAVPSFLKKFIFKILISKLLKFSHQNI